MARYLYRPDPHLIPTIEEYCPACGQQQTWRHDHKTDLSGLDDGPPLPGETPRKKAIPKDAATTREIRRRAWATRRAKYGPRGTRRFNNISDVPTTEGDEG